MVCLRVVESDAGIEKGRYRTEAEELMEYIQTKNSDNKAINLVLEFAVGKVNKVIDDMVSQLFCRCDITLLTHTRSTCTNQLS